MAQGGILGPFAVMCSLVFLSSNVARAQNRIKPMTANIITWTTMGTMTTVWAHPWNQCTPEQDTHVGNVEEQERGHQHDKRQYWWNKDLEFRRMMDTSRDLEFAQGREMERRRIGKLPSRLQQAARAAFEKESQDLEVVRQRERDEEQQARGDCVA